MDSGLPIITIIATLWAAAFQPLQTILEACVAVSATICENKDVLSKMAIPSWPTLQALFTVCNGLQSHPWYCRRIDDAELKMLDNGRMLVEPETIESSPIWLDVLVRTPPLHQPRGFLANYSG
jgi:hypothetical protein